MSGWIKLEKDLRDDPRVRRMASALVKRGTVPSACAVTLVIGALGQIWMYADSFARNDDTLPIGPDEVDQITGIDGFAQLMPRQWLEILESDCVKLPGFQSHNGPVAKKRAQQVRRVTQHRKQVKRTSVSKSVNSANASALAAGEHAVTHMRYTAPSSSPSVSPSSDSQSLHPVETPVGVKRGRGREGGAENGNGHALENALQCHGSLPLATWDEWLTYRRARRWPMSELVLRKQLALLARFTQEEQREILEQSIRSNWQGLFPIKTAKGPAKPAEPPWRAPPDEAA